MSITFYMKRSHQEVVHQVLRSLEVYRRAVGPQALAWYAHPYKEDWYELDDKGWEEHGPGRVRELALELAAELPFNSGHAGLAFHFPESILGTTEAIHDLALRYPGLDIAEVCSTAYSIGTRVNGVHWLNFLGQPVLGELGGATGLRARLHSPGTTVQELDGERAVVTLGKWPEAGDLEQGRPLPAYRELARVLEPWLYLDRARFSGFSAEDMHRWVRRFLD